MLELYEQIITSIAVTSVHEATPQITVAEYEAQNRQIELEEKAVEDYETIVGFLQENNYLLIDKIEAEEIVVE